VWWERRSTTTTAIIIIIISDHPHRPFLSHFAGHMYERLLRIMMLSVRTVVQCTVSSSSSIIIIILIIHYHHHLIIIIITIIIHHQVSRQTSQPVKFWLFENYLSPTFKQSGE